MSLFSCRKSTEHSVSVLSRYQTQRHGILSFSRKPIGSWVEIHISVDRLVFDQIYNRDIFDIFDILSLTKEISLHCYFASFETPTELYSPQVYHLPKDTECLFSTKIPIHSNLENKDVKNKDQIANNFTSDQDTNINNAKWAILFQDILDSCETFRGEYGFVIPFVVLNATDVKPKLHPGCKSENQRYREEVSGNTQEKNTGKNTDKNIDKEIKPQDSSHCYYTLNCFNYTAGIWKIRTKPLAIATQELKKSQDSPSVHFSESA